MATEFQGPPAVNFYSMLSGLGDTIVKNRQDSAIADAFQPGANGKVDYTQALGTVARYNPSLAVAMQNHVDTQAQQAIETARQASNDAFTHNYQTQSLALQQGAAKRAQYEFDHTPDQYSPNPNAGQPGQPAIIDNYAAATRASAGPKIVTIKRPGPFGTTVDETNLLNPDGSLSPINGRSAVSPAVPSGGGIFGGMSKPIGWDDAPAPRQAAPQQVASATPLAAPAPMPQSSAPLPAVASAAPPSFNDRFAAAAPQSVAPAAASIAPATQPNAPVNLDAIDPTTGRRENWLKNQSPMEQAYIKKIADYQIDPRTTSTKGGMRENVLSSVAQYDPSYDQNEFGSRSKAIKDFATGPQGNSVRSFDVGISHLDTLEKYITALNSGDIPAVNKLRNIYLQQTGSPLPTNVQAVGPIVGAEVSKAIIGSGNALADREELRKPLLGSGAPDQILGSIHAYKELMGGQLKGLKKQYEDTTGRKNFESRISDSTRSQLLGPVDGSPSGSQSGNVTSTGVKWSIQ